MDALYDGRGYEDRAAHSPSARTDYRIRVIDAVSGWIEKHFQDGQTPKHTAAE